MKVFYKIVNGFRVKYCSVYFCIGIGMDQFTPVYARFTARHTLGPVYSKKDLFCTQVQSNQEQSKSLATSNYGRRARHKN